MMAAPYRNVSFSARCHQTPERRVVGQFEIKKGTNKKGDRLLCPQSNSMSNQGSQDVDRAVCPLFYFKLTHYEKAGHRVAARLCSIARTRILERVLQTELNDAWIYRGPDDISPRPVIRAAWH